MSSATDVDLQKVLRDNGFDNSELRMRSWELNCTVPTILEFPALFRKKNILHPTLCGIFSLYLFIMLGVLCNDYLVPSMERLCYALRMTYDVAGATFLAAATSTPELFVNFVGTFVTEGDIGVAAIVGSSVFNTLAVAAVCGIFTGVSEQLDWWPITRDIIWYLIAIAALCAVLYDANVSAIESGLMLACYFCYLLLLVLDRVIQSFFRGDNIYTTQVTEDPLDREESPLMSFRDHVCRMPGEESGKCAFIWWIIKYPCALILALTIPSVRTFYFLTMLMAIIWIGATCYLLTWFLTVIGYNIGIPDTLMGLTVLAAGTSVPEAISSYILTKKVLLA
ncbi:sodium/potassium/calcium exchanger 3 isoform X2 [Scaptodrosophila lebanonensis]|uniref:Sodium/potassium/calcium exchanger 3 isoform X2 n=1 Tax=Drosophila lebanonensis TaxID=7225 RepID=A0A6J2TT16_DROLE|nr:sodium/potassium/calcium exchanger 3 isoform X2 [Scaptodrosophila lebanonensis]